MMAIQFLQQAIRYMEDHLLENINYEDAAKSAHMSSCNFHRTFSFIAGLTANEYIRNRRLSLAGQELQTTGIYVIDATLKYGYESPESFAKLFHVSTDQLQSRQSGKVQSFIYSIPLYSK